MLINLAGLFLAIRVRPFANHKKASYSREPSTDLGLTHVLLKKSYGSPGFPLNTFDCPSSCPSTTSPSELKQWALTNGRDDVTWLKATHVSK